MDHSDPRHLGDPRIAVAVRRRRLRAVVRDHCRRAGRDRRVAIHSRVSAVVDRGLRPQLVDHPWAGHLRRVGAHFRLVTVGERLARPASAAPRPPVAWVTRRIGREHVADRIRRQSRSTGSLSYTSRPRSPMKSLLDGPISAGLPGRRHELLEPGGVPAAGDPARRERPSRTQPLPVSPSYFSSIAVLLLFL